MIPTALRVFTGIIEETGAIESATPLAGGRRLRVACSFARELREDESVAVNGTCLTVVAAGEDAFEAVVVEETLYRTTLGALEAGDLVNLERALRIGGRLDGHLVQGHVDVRGRIRDIEVLKDSHLILVEYPMTHAPLLIHKGSVAIDGISLTVARLDEPAGTLAVAVIPHTLASTNAREWQPGREVNLEFDLLGKYLQRAQALHDRQSGVEG